MAPNDDQVHEAVAHTVRYYKSRHTENPVVYVQEETRWRIYAGGRLIRESAGVVPAPMLAQREEITQEQAQDLIALGRAKAERGQAERAEAELARRKQERGLAAKFWRSRRAIIPVIVLLACLAGWLSYCYVGLPDVQEEDLLWATVDKVAHPPIELDLTDPAMREEVAGVLNSLHRWIGTPIDCVPSISLDVKLRDGPTYYVCLYPHDSLLELVIDGGGPDGEISRMWVKSRDASRFLKEYLER